jgi:hypothetical protein
MIYTGACKFLGLIGNKLPPQLRVLENDIPISYWFDCRSSYKPRQHLFHDNQYINIDIRDKVSKLVENARTENGKIYSSFGNYRVLITGLDLDKLLNAEIGIFLYVDGEDLILTELIENYF